MSEQATLDAPRLSVPDRELSRARMKVGRAAWAARYYKDFSRDAVLAIAEAVAKAGYEKAAQFAEEAVAETGFGVVEHKTIKNRLCTHELLDYYRDLDLVRPRVDEARKIIELPKPAGVVFALAPATNPVATVYYKAMLAILSRNAIVLSPHPASRSVSAAAAQHIAQAAEAAGAPAGLIQCVENPSVPLVQDIMASDRINVILATGGTAMVRAAYSSGNPALGVGPGNAVAYIDPTARVDAAARCLVESKAFDNSVLCTNESVAITLGSNRGNMERALRSAGAHVCNAADTDRLRDYLFTETGFNLEAIGKSATWIAERAGLRVNPSTKILVPVVETPGQDDLLFREKLCPVLTLTAAGDFEQALTFAKHTTRRGAGHSAAFHGEDTDRLVAFSQGVPVYRVVVNAPCSQGAAGFATHLPPSFTIGTGFAGRSSIGENLGPQHLVQWTRIAYGKDAPADLGGVDLDAVSSGRAMPAAPAASPEPADPQGSGDVSRDDLRRLILEELRSLKGGDA
ncbi:aldehyde dehydrogenase family protein [Roseovarius atlanticus]|uniref:aldehyde dehydrogenase family protein n=1 Tax=Roseovarius atlanticus TaxID=1641875 RepID=UPI001C93BDB2|nr:aldehyde dehydrogenase family protein [Roseovarius atlanticus]MBY5987713.1 aldehyde dehydrogenase family protein [Roseovarius atlanticus]MBY6123104.1 aldehyde dehydrogenase family protein [Roseovarius atlanticus]MBY6147600.1 aldehyde dehydrogenase family protein [Roseovarius atlanticus]